MDKSGSLYGTAGGCGASNMGIVWKLAKKGTETVLHNFAGGSSDGAGPAAGVIMDTQGNFYGDTMVWRWHWMRSGRLRHGVYAEPVPGRLPCSMSSTGPDGGFPLGGVIMDGNGNLYGTASVGGGSGYGTVWKLTP